MSKNSITVTAHDGGTFHAFIAMPDVLPAPVVIVIQEIFGINNELREKCVHLADQGYIAICPDLFWRIEPGTDLVDSVPEQLQRAFHLLGEFDVALGIEDLTATLDHARGMKESNDKVACIGYCLGGKLAYMMAAQTDVDAAVSYYGIGLGTILDAAEDITEPLLLHIAGNDEYVPKDEQAKILAAMEDHPTAETYVYPGMNHAFARGNGMHYNAEAAKLANGRTEKFLKSTIG